MEFYSIYLNYQFRNKYNPLPCYRILRTNVILSQLDDDLSQLRTATMLEF